MGPMFQLSLRQLAGRWRLLLILLLAALPVVLVSIVSIVASDSNEGHHDPDFINVLLDGMIVGGIMPIVTMVLATTAFGHEVEDRTLSYLVLKPVRRSLIVLPKLLASIVICGPLLIASGITATLVGYGGDAQTAVAVGVAIFAGVAAYTAIFTWAGLVSAHALGFALLYVFMWEGLISTFLGGVRYLSVRGYTLAIMYGIDESEFEVLGQRVIEFPAAIGGAVAVTVVFFWLTVLRLRRMDVP